MAQAVVAAAVFVAVLAIFGNFSIHKIEEGNQNSNNGRFLSCQLLANCEAEVLLFRCWWCKLCFKSGFQFSGYIPGIQCMLRGI